MIFPNYDYKEYHNGNKNEWPVQPPTQEAWNEMHNKAVSYCENISPEDYPKHIKPTQLPSFHPYWGLQAQKNTYEYALLLIEKLKKCLKDYSLFKYEFNRSASKEKIALQIQNLLKECLDMPKVDLSFL